MNKESKIIALVAILFLIGFGFLVWKGKDIAGTAPKEVDPTYLVREGSHATGPAGAKVTMVEFGDFQCPACAAVAPYLKQVVGRYAGNPNFSFVFRNYPLPQHANTQISAEAAEAAGAQGKYFEMNELLYAKQNDWANLADPLPVFEGYARTLGLDLVKFRNDVITKAHREVIDADMRDGDAIRINHTPTVFINGVELKSYDPAAVQALIDSLLAQ